MTENHLPRIRRQAFTLIELLVVISIIGLLVAILLPALGKARNAAVAIKCASNVRQVNYGFYSYQTDNKDYVLPYAAPTPPDITTNYWFTVLLDRGYVQSNADKGTIVISTVTASVMKDSMPPLRCIDEIFPSRYSSQNVRKLGLPSDPVVYLYPSSNQSRFIVSYSLNKQLGTSATLQRSTAATHAPSDIIYFTCGDKMKSLDTPTNWNIYNMFVHNGATNTAYLDGHVAARKPGDIQYQSQLDF